ncbi:UNVERIFIED_CONTAM: hypothetical protein GTU68_049149 [Idotea baltica]|nr:hypothetical protein [Idotea baltica]
MIWATKTNTRALSKGITRVEDGFLRSRGLGADLVAPLSLVLDDLGIYYDATTQSRLEHLITEAASLPQDHLKRAPRLVESIKRLGLSKYNTGGKPRPRPGTRKGVCILVPGQVEDDASILMGAHGIKTNLDLLKAARAANPNATLLYKPHPDVEAGLRPGIIDTDDLNGLANDVLNKTDPIMAIEAAHEVWTITSLLGFEALLRGRRVTCLGMPFYAGWGLTNDLAPAPKRRKARPSIDALAHAVLISYPRYQDPKTNRPCPPEVIVERLRTGDGQRSGPVNRTLAKAQGALAPYSALWRRQ